MANGNDPPDDDAALRARLDSLSGELKARRPEAAAGARPSPPKSTDNFASGMSMGLRAGSEFVAAILVGGAIGWGLDWALRTKPAFTIVFFLLGVAAGVWNVIRATSPKRAPPPHNSHNSRLSDATAPDKDVPRGAPSGGDGDGE
jgi:ATP synthase protein I